LYFARHPAPIRAILLYGKIPPPDMKVTDVFTPGSLPEHTYNSREDLRLEWRLLEALETKGIIGSVSGPSKSGKTVLCESVVGKRKMLLVTGGGVSNENSFWQKVRQKIGIPESRTRGQQVEFGMGGGAQIKGEMQLPLFANAGASAEAKSNIGLSQEDSNTFVGLSGVDLLMQLQKKGFTFVVDDFHYISRDVQRSLAEQFKEAARQGASLVVVSVSHRSDEAIRANPDLRGRVSSIDIPYWRKHELAVIASKGFPILNVSPSPEIIDRFVSESVSSPQLMQAICLQFCREMVLESRSPIRREITLKDDEMGNLLKNTTSFANCKTAFDIIVTGPKPRGSERNSYRLRDGRKGDIYYVILKAAGGGEPLLTMSYATLKQRIEEVVSEEPPRGVGIIQALQQMDKSVVNKLGEDRVLEWDEEKEFLNFSDPYFLYYLRWADW
jgi:hypothetical protein